MFVTQIYAVSSWHAHPPWSVCWEYLFKILALLKILKTFAAPRPSCDSKLAPLLRLAWCAYSWFACVDASRCCCCFLCTQMWSPFPPSEKKKEVTEEVAEHVLHGISWSGQILSFRFVLIVTVTYPVSWRFYSTMMFPRRSLFRSLFAAGNTHIVAKSLLVCVLYGYNDRLKRFLSFSVRGALQLAAVSSQVHVLLTNFNEFNEWQAECPLWPILDAEWLFLYLRLSQAHQACFIWTKLALAIKGKDGGITWAITLAVSKTYWFLSILFI